MLRRLNKSLNGKGVGTTTIPIEKRETTETGKKRSIKCLSMYDRAKTFVKTIKEMSATDVPVIKKTNCGRLARPARSRKYLLKVLLLSPLFLMGVNVTFNLKYNNWRRQILAYKTIFEFTLKTLIKCCAKKDGLTSLSVAYNNNNNNNNNNNIGGVNRLLDLNCRI
ncbi:hypothetical protein GQX74_003462 [Glossina fuscipes]|nr:hypothetical protein GQX74_003462 [Glossina fuscipes]